MRVLLIQMLVVVFATTPSTLFAQRAGLKRDTTLHQLAIPVPPTEHSRPAITLQKALTLAEDYLRREHVDTTGFYLWRVKMIEYGAPEGPKEDRWFFWWVHEDSADGHYLWITVSMDGKVYQSATM